MRSWHLLNMALLKVEQGHFETAILIIHNFSSFLRLQVLRIITLNILIIQTLCTVMQLLKGSYSDRIRLSRTVQRTYLWVLFHLLQGRVYTLCRTKRGLGVINLKTRLVGPSKYKWPPDAKSASFWKCRKIVVCQTVPKEIQNRKPGEKFLLEVSRRHYPQKPWLHAIRRQEKRFESTKHKDLFSSF